MQIDTKTIDMFEVFSNRLDECFERKRAEKRNLLKIGNYFLDYAPGRIAVCKGDKSTQNAFFYKERSWIDDPVLFSVLKEILPEFLPYFKNEKNLVLGENWSELW